MAISDRTIADLIQKKEMVIKNNNFDFEKTFAKGSKKRIKYYKYMDKLQFKHDNVKKLPFDGRQIESASMDLRLGNDFYEIKTEYSPVKLGEKLNYKKVDSPVVIYPGNYMLATTQEHIKIPNYIAATVDGRSSIGRLGLHVENAGWVDPGFEGEITLELFNSGDAPIELVPGHRVCQLVFEYTDKEPAFPYRGKYQGQKGATGSKIYLDYDIND